MLMQVAGTCVGTGLCAASANAFNQSMEVKHDARMTRTAARVLPAGLLSVPHAVGFAIGTGIAGTALIAASSNTLAAGLALANIGLYAGLYTPLKRVTFLNTWVGAVVGAIPPMIGYAALSGGIDATAVLLGGVLFSWQMPHFMALAYNLRADYSRAGYVMLPALDAVRAAAVGRRHALGVAAMSAALALLHVVSPLFLLDATALNAYLVWSAHKFAQNQSDASARALFRTTLWHLPALLALMALHKTVEHESIPQLPVASAVED